MNDNPTIPRPILILSAFLAAMAVASCSGAADVGASSDPPANDSGSPNGATDQPAMPDAGPPPSAPGPSNKLAFVYRGPVVGCDGCSEAIARVLRSSKWGLDVHYVGPDEKIKLTADVLKTAGVYAQPGGDGDVGESNTLMKQQLGGSNVVLDWVKAGGRFYGTCMGGYLAGKPDKSYPRVSDKRWPGFNLLPGTVGEWIEQSNASVKNDNETVVELLWKGQPRWVYFQDGPSFVLDPGANATVLATYKSNGIPAVLVTTVGAGKVALSGPHLEAEQDWFDSEHVTDPDDPDGRRHHAHDLAGELVDTLME